MITKSGAKLLDFGLAKAAVPLSTGVTLTAAAVRPFPGPGGKWQISTGGGHYPKWSRNGKELFYRSADNKIMAANYITSGDSFHADKAQVWSPGQFSSIGFALSFDLHPDGKRFAVLKARGTGEVPEVDKVSFIFNFFDELRRKVPPGKN